MKNSNINIDRIRHLKYIAFGFGSSLAFSLVSVLFAINEYTIPFFINTVVAGVLLGVSIFALLLLFSTESD